MNKFAAINRLYAEHFGLRPPARVCVQGTGAMGMAAIAVSDTEVANVHVQSFSAWAPANIGPYSQANMIKESGLVLLAGQIGLDPAFMDFRRPSIGDQYSQEAMACDQFAQILTNLERVIADATQDDDDPLKYLSKAIVFLP